LSGASVALRARLGQTRGSAAACHDECFTTGLVASASAGLATRHGQNGRPHRTSNPKWHVTRSNDHRGARRGFLPRGLCNTCPHAARARDHLREGRCRTSLNCCGHSTLRDSRPLSANMASRTRNRGSVGAYSARRTRESTVSEPGNGSPQERLLQLVWSVDQGRRKAYIHTAANHARGGAASNHLKSDSSAKFTALINPTVKTPARSMAGSAPASRHGSTQVAM